MEVVAVVEVVVEVVAAVDTSVVVVLAGTEGHHFSWMLRNFCMEHLDPSTPFVV